MKKILLLKKRSAVFIVIILTALLFLQIPVYLYIETVAVSNDKDILQPGLNYVIFVDCEENKLYLLLDGECVKEYKVACGSWDTPSPIGSWMIISKATWGEGFGGRWMGINVPWGQYGIHGTTQPNSIGWNSSHGCIRMNNKDVAELYKIVPYKTPVIIVNGVFGVFGTGFRNLKPGSRGADVLAVQKRLKELGYYTGYPDGIYGEGMKSAVHKYQKDNDLYVTNTISRSMLESLGFREFD